MGWLGAGSGCELEPVAPRPAHALGLPVSQTILHRGAGHQGFTVCFDHRTRNPAWVLERLSRSNAGGKEDRRHCSFQEDDGVLAKFRSHLAAFAHSGYDRGHMAAAADHNRSGECGLADTFLLSNISPQTPWLNRGPWKALERSVRGLVESPPDQGNSAAEEGEEGSAFDEVFVLSGPLYLPTVPLPAPTAGASVVSVLSRVVSYNVLGTSESVQGCSGPVAVPTHFFKVVLARDERQDARRQLHLAAFVLPNLASSEGEHGGSDCGGTTIGGGAAAVAATSARLNLTDYLVPLESVERASGLDIFPCLLADANVRESLRLAERVVLEGRTGLLKENGRAGRQPLGGPLEVRHLCAEPLWGRGGKRFLSAKLSRE
jgi:endonuclease G